MELIEGPTLKELLSAGPLPMKRILRIAAQVADGLAKAHGAGVVHRDLKPENVMVAEDGNAKIVDFGLATASNAEDRKSGDTTIPTAMTEPGAVMGTVAYMSPEQARGSPSTSARTSFPSVPSSTRCSRAGRRSRGGALPRR